jgi:hypothetical protein
MGSKLPTKPPRSAIAESVRNREANEEIERLRNLVSKLQSDELARTTHLTWSIEVGDNQCPDCKVDTVLVVAPLDWSVDQEGRKYEGEYATVHDEVTGHWCPKCERLRSLSLNTRG